MQAQKLVFPRQNRCEVNSVELDEALGANEVLIRNHVSLISAGTELAMFTRSHRGFDEPDFSYAKYPIHPGYAAVGRVIAIGATVRDVAIGDRVFHSGHHATVVKIDASRCVHLPDELPDESGLFLSLLKISIGAHRIEPLRFGESAVILGMGIVGNLCAQLCREAGAHRVLCADRLVSRLHTAQACGLPMTFAMSEDKSLPEYVAESLPEGAGYVVEAVGLPPTIDACLKSVAPLGRVILLGSPRQQMEIDPYFDIHRRGIRIIGAHISCVAGDVIQQGRAHLVALLAENRIHVEPLITQRVNFTEALCAYEGLRDNPSEYLGVVLSYA